MIVEELVSKLGLEIDSGALGTLEKFKSAVTGGLAGMAAAGAAVASAFAAIVGSTAKAADEIGDVSDKLGVAPKALQELKFAAERAEVSFEGLQTGLKFIAKNAVEAAQGNEELAKAFAGVGLRDAAGKIRPANELLTALADKFVTLPDDATRTNMAIKLFGRAGADLVPLLKKGSAGIAELSAKANELGVVMSDDVISAGGEFDDAMKDVRDSVTGLRNTLGGPFIKLFASGLKSISKFFVQMRPQIQAFSKAIMDVGERFAGMGKLVLRLAEGVSKALDGSFIGKLLKGVDVLALLEAAIIGLGVVFALVALKTVIAWVAAFAPFILLATLIGLIVDELYNFIEGNDTLLGRVIKWAEAFDPNGNPVLEFFKSAIALLFDLTDPAKWERFVGMWMSINTLLGDITIKAFEYVGAKIAELLGSGIQAVFDKFPLLKRLVASQVDGIGAVANALGVGDAFGAAKETVTGALGLGGGPKQSDLVAGQLGTLASKLNPFGDTDPQKLFSGGASGPDAAGAIASTPASNADNRSVKQTNQITINATQMNPEELSSHVGRVLQSQHQEALASLPR